MNKQITIVFVLIFVLLCSTLGALTETRRIRKASSLPVIKAKSTPVTATAIEKATPSSKTKAAPATAIEKVAPAKTTKATPTIIKAKPVPATAIEKQAAAAVKAKPASATAIEKTTSERKAKALPSRKAKAAPSPLKAKESPATRKIRTAPATAIEKVVPAKVTKVTPPRQTKALSIRKAPAIKPKALSVRKAKSMPATAIEKAAPKVNNKIGKSPNRKTIKTVAPVRRHLKPQTVIPKGRNEKMPSRIRARKIRHQQANKKVKKSSQNITSKVGNSNVWKKDEDNMSYNTKVKFDNSIFI